MAGFWEKLSYEVTSTMYSFRVPGPLVKASNLLSKSFVLERLRSFHDEPQSGIILNKRRFGCSKTILSARIANGIDREASSSPPREGRRCWLLHFSDTLSLPIFF